MKNTRLSTFPPLFLINLTNIVIDVVVTFLGLRFLLKFFGASATAPFVQWIYNTTNSLLWPFRGIFPTEIEGGFIIEFSTLFAIIAYILVGYLITEILESLMFRVSQRTSREK